MLLKIGALYVAVVFLINYLEIRMSPVVGGAIGGVIIIVAVLWLGRPTGKKKASRKKGAGNGKRKRK